MAVRQLHPEHRSGQHVHHYALTFDCIFPGHSEGILKNFEAVGKTSLEACRAKLGARGPPQQASLQAHRQQLLRHQPSLSTMAWPISAVLTARQPGVQISAVRHPC